MGCTNIRSELSMLEKPLNYSFETIPNYDDINLKFQEASQIIKKIESIRLLTIDKKYELLYRTGGCCKINPTFITIFKSLLWVLGMESNGNVLSKQLYFNQGEEPYFSIANSNPTNQNISTEINEYIKKVIEYQETIAKTKDDCKQMLQGFKENVDKYSVLLNKGQSTGTITKEACIFASNMQLINVLNRDSLAETIFDKFNDDYKEIGMIGDLINDKEFIKQVNDIGIISKVYVTRYEIIYYNLSDDQRYGEKPSHGEEDYMQTIEVKKSLYYS